jgi:hypothetical protein
MCSGKMVAAHWVNELVAEASTFGSLDGAPKSSVVAYGMEDTVHASTGEPYLSF